MRGDPALPLRVPALVLTALCLAVTATATYAPAFGAQGSAKARQPTAQAPPPPFADAAERLLRQLSLDEKISQMSTVSPAINRSSGTLIPAFNWWQECLHGVQLWDAAERGGTIYPQPIGLAAAFDRRLMLDVSSAIGDELRATSNEAEQQGKGPRMTNCFGPNINIFRDPRWGRGSETYGEDPLLTGEMAKAFVRGLQGNHSRYLKAGATCKHFAAYSLEEWEGISRFEFDARLDPRDVRDAYLPAFHACVTEARAASVMCSYNAVNGTPACASAWLLREQLRGGWDFRGFVVSDCGAIESISDHHEWAPSHAEGAAAALKAGTDLACSDYSHVRRSVDQGLVSETDIDAAVRRLLLARFALGHFDAPGGGDNPFRRIPPSVVGSRAHLALARRAAASSIVLLKNEPASPPAAAGEVAVAAGLAAGWPPNGAPDGSAVVAALAAAAPAAVPLLPLKLGDLRRLTVLGPFANRSEYMLGSYYAFPAGGSITTPYQAIADRLAAHNKQQEHQQAQELLRHPQTAGTPSSTGTAAGTAGGTASTAGTAVQLDLLTGTEVMGTGADVEGAVTACRRSDVCVFFLGTTAVANLVKERTHYGTLPLLSPVVEAEGWDRKHIGLPGRQLNLVQAVAKRSSTPIVVVLVHGGPLDVEWLQRSCRVAAILTAWTPGQGAAAIADVLFGDVAPGGRLPVSFPFQNYTAQSDFTDMSMRRWPGRTHRYLQVPVLYPFGRGLSYTTFAYTHMTATSAAAIAAAGTLHVPLPGYSTAGGGSSGNGGSSDTSSSGRGSSDQPEALLHVAFNVANTGSMAGDEVALLYLSFTGSSTKQQQQQRQGQMLWWWRRRMPTAGHAVSGPAILLSMPCSSSNSSSSTSSSNTFSASTNPAGGSSQPEGLPVQALVGFERVHLGVGGTAPFSFHLTEQHFVPFSPLPADQPATSSSSSSDSGTSRHPAALPYCGDYLLRAGGQQQLAFRLEHSGHAAVPAAARSVQ